MIRNKILKIRPQTYRLKPSCPQCPYTLGLVHTLINPCPQCKEAGYQMFEQFQKEQSRNYSVSAAMKKGYEDWNKKQ